MGNGGFLRAFYAYIAALLALIAFSPGCRCDYPHPDVNYDQGTIPETVANFSAINSEYDDVNIAANPHVSKCFNLYLSTNRGAAQNGYDFHISEVCYSFDLVSGDFTIYGYCDSAACVQPLNSPGNEFGPLLVHLGKPLWRERDTAEIPGHTHDRFWSWDNQDSSFVLFFSSDRDSTGGDLDLWATNAFRLWDTRSSSQKTYLEAFEVKGLNSSGDDAYLTFGPEQTGYLCSNRHGDYDIYSFATPIFSDRSEFFAFFADTSTSYTLTPVSALNTASNEKCPFIHDSSMYFISDRPGGQGGYDIWKSQYNNSGWGAPINLGDNINSSGNENRPVAVSCGDFTNLLLIFSSDRAGGKGGYDIYYTGY